MLTYTWRKREPLLAMYLEYLWKEEQETCNWVFPYQGTRSQGNGYKENSIFALHLPVYWHFVSYICILY